MFSSPQPQKAVMQKPLAYSQLEIELARMSALVETNLAEAISAFDRRDIATAQALIPIDAKVDAHHQTIELSVYQLLQAQTLDAAEIRGAMSIIKIAADLERVGDLAKNIARRICVISHEQAWPNHSGVTRMAQRSLQQFSDVLNAYSARDLSGAYAVWHGDEEVDQLYHSVFRELLLAMREDPDLVNSTTHLVFIAKNFERVGDHATNIAETLHYKMTGEHLDENRLRTDTIMQNSHTRLYSSDESTPIGD